MAVFAPLSYVVADHKFFFHPGKAICMHDLESLLRGYGIFLSLYVAVPLFIIVTCYSKVFIAVRKHSLNLHHRQGTESNPARLTVEEIDLTYTLTCVVFGFLICWTPVVTVDTIDFVRCDWLLSRPVYMAYTCFGSTSMAVNPIIYGIRNRAFRREYYKISSGCHRVPADVYPAAVFSHKAQVKIGANANHVQTISSNQGEQLLNRPPASSR